MAGTDIASPRFTGVYYENGKRVAAGAAAVNNAFVPSAYSALKSATTTVAGQSEALASNAGRIRVANLDATNYALIAFGTSAGDAETSAANGVVIPKATSMEIGVPVGATHYAWLGNTGTVSLAITQGV